MNERTKHLTAAAYRGAANRPELYPAFIAETLAQAERLTGLRVIPVNETEPYATSRKLFADVERGIIRVNAVDSLTASHPLHSRHAVKAWGVTLSANVIFRVVHDILGHYDTGQPFETFQGEQRAYERHTRQYSNPAALAVLHSETMGQLAAYFDGEGFQSVQYPKVTL